jgi:hypothetical protein
MSTDLDSAFVLCDSCASHPPDHLLTTFCSPQEYHTLMSTNLESAFVLCQLCQPLLAAAGSSCVIFNSSVAGGPTAMWCAVLFRLGGTRPVPLFKGFPAFFISIPLSVDGIPPVNHTGPAPSTR